MISSENNRGFQQYGRTVPGLVFPEFKRQFKWRGADMQTLRNVICGPALSLQGDYQRISFELASGQCLKAALHRPEKSASRPLIVIIHGLTGDETSANVMSTAACFSGRGFAVLRLNLRGAGPSAQTSTGPYHGGLSADLSQVIDQLLLRNYGTGIILYGISLGGNMMLKYLGEKGAQAPVLAAIGVSTPLSLRAVQRRLMAPRNRLYHNHLLSGMKAYARQMAVKVTGKREARLLAKAAAARTILEYDDQFIAPAHGMSGAAEYYRIHSAEAYVENIRTPTLLIHARNDPWVPVAAYHKRRWLADGAVSLLIADDGGHVGFHGKGHKVPWQDRVAAKYLEYLPGKGDLL